MRTVALVASLASIAPVRTANAQPPYAPVPGTVIRNEGRNTGPNTKTFERVEPQNTFKAVEGAYRIARVVPTTVDRADFRLLYVVSPAPKSIGNVRLKDAFDCGGDKKSPIAELVELEVTIRSEVSAYGAAGSQALTMATAKPLGNTPDGETPVCKSTGRLESKLEPDIRTKSVTVIRRR